MVKKFNEYKIDKFSFTLYEKYDEEEDSFFIDTDIRVMNIEKMNLDITETAKEYKKETEEWIHYVVGNSSALGLMKSETGDWIMVDKELIGTFLTDDKLDLDIYKRTDAHDGENGTIGMMPELKTTMSLDDLLKYVKGEESIKDFMGNRYQYNSRIMSNMREFKNFVEHGK